MWAKFRPSNARKVLWESEKSELIREARKSLNINEEYLNALRTKSFADFFTNTQILGNKELSSQPDCLFHNHPETLLVPSQESINAILESAVLSKLPEVKSLMLKYFDISSKASKTCSHLLNSISQIHYNYQFIEKALDSTENLSSDNVISQLNSFIVQDNPLLKFKKLDFKLINEEYSTMLHHLKSKRRKIVRRTKLMQFIGKSSGICMIAACSLISLIVLLLVGHAFAGIIVGPLVISLPVNKMNRKLLKSFQFFSSEFMKKVGEQLDVAAKGTYIVNRNFDTMGRLVVRLHDEVEHNKTVVQFCMQRIVQEKLSLEVMEEMKRTNIRKRVEELEEHVCLCLVTINRARSMVIKELTKSCIKEF